MTAKLEAVVTGASRGLGLALAQEFAMRGHDVVLVARDAGRLEAAASSLRASAPGRVLCLPLDLAVPDASDRLSEGLARIGAKPEILVNNVAWASVGAFSGSDRAQLRRGIDLNVRLPTELALHFLPRLLQAGRGGILNVASLAGIVPFPGLALYSAGKHFLVALSRAVASEIAGSGVTVSVLLPGPLDTQFLEEAGQQRPNLLERFRAMPPEIVARVAYDGFAAGQRVIVPGLVNMVYYAGIRALPTGLIVRGLRRAFLPGGAGAVR